MTLASWMFTPLNSIRNTPDFMAYNPLQLHMDRHGRMVDKYGREFVFKPAKMKKLRKPLNAGGRVWKSYHAHERKT